MTGPLAGWLLLIGGLTATGGWLSFAFFDPGHERRAEPIWLGFNLPIIFGGLLIAFGLVLLSAGRGALETATLLTAAAGFAIAHLGVHSLETATDEVGSLFLLLVTIAQPLMLVGGLGVGVVLVVAAEFPSWTGGLVIAGVVLTTMTRFIATPPVVTRGVIPAFGSLTLALVGAVQALKVL